VAPKEFSALVRTEENRCRKVGKLYTIPLQCGMLEWFEQDGVACTLILLMLRKEKRSGYVA